MVTKVGGICYGICLQFFFIVCLFFCWHNLPGVLFLFPWQPQCLFLKKGGNTGWATVIRQHLFTFEIVTQNALHIWSALKCGCVRKSSSVADCQDKEEHLHSSSWLFNVLCVTSLMLTWKVWSDIRKWNMGMARGCNVLIVMTHFPEKTTLGPM
jgi:hypothetical protein